MKKNEQLADGILRMDRVREILRLKDENYCQREIWRATGIARSVIQRYLRSAALAGVTYQTVKELSDDELRATLGKRCPGRDRATGIGEPNWEKLHADYGGRKGVTLELLWLEWVQASGGGFSYETFCRRYREWCGVQDVIYHNDYRPGEMMLSDYAGETLSWWDESGTEYEAAIFVSVLGMSNYIYAEATPSQSLLYWLGAHQRAFEFNQGVTAAVICDNLKTGVTHADRYEPDIQRSFAELAAHYATAILPTRIIKPRDKAKVEKAVQDVERWILAVLRNERFSSVAEINVAIKRLLTTLNDKQMRTYKASRRELFERYEVAALKPLPVTAFAAAQWKLAHVNLDYHVALELHYYSVPWHLARQEVWLRISEHLVEIFHNNQSMAVHRRSSEPYRYSTIEAHMPPHHRAKHNWTAETFILWSHKVGGNTAQFVEALLEQARHPEQAYRSILGLQRLEKKFGM